MCSFELWMNDTTKSIDFGDVCLFYLYKYKYGYQ